MGHMESQGTVSRRDFLRVGGLSVVGMTVAERAALARQRDRADRRSCIFVMMTGGPSQFETFDPKPDAPVSIRGPLKAISTAIPGVAFSESLPLLAERANRLAVLRSLYHDAAPIHETGLQLLQTGRLARGTLRYPSFGSVVAQTTGPRNGVAPYVVLPGLLNNTGVNTWRGQSSGWLGPAFEPLTDSVEEQAEPVAPIRNSLLGESESVRRMYGDTRFGRLLVHARQLVECGVRCVTVNLFDSLAGQVTWDCHGRAPDAPGTLYDYRDHLCPQFDRAFSGLLDDLEQRGLLDDTLVVATGEFGRSAAVNDACGRDHSPEVWSGVAAGGGVSGGRVLGASDAYGMSPVDYPIHAGRLVATIYDSLGVDASRQLRGPDGSDVSLTDHAPVTELWG